MNCAEMESRPVFGPAGNKQVTKSQRKADKVMELDDAKAKRTPSLSVVCPSPSERQLQAAAHCCSVPSILRRHDERLLRSSLSLNASCSSEASSDSSQSRASTGRINRRSITPIRRKHCGSKGKVEKVATEFGSADVSPVKKRCAWVTSNTDPCYVNFHDEEWGVPVHEDKKLFELLALSTSLAEVTWPTILCKRQLFREVFLDFDPIAVSQFNEKKTVTSGSAASSLLSEMKLRAIIENARQVCKIIDEFGSFNKYIWGFVSHKPIVSHFRYPRQVPIRTSKADAISKDLVRRGFRGVGPTVVYSFMQVAGITNDHLISCFRFQDCIVAADATDKDSSLNGIIEDKQPISIDIELVRAINDLSLPM